MQQEWFVLFLRVLAGIAATWRSGRGDHSVLTRQTGSIYVEFPEPGVMQCLLHPSADLSLLVSPALLIYICLASYYSHLLPMGCMTMRAIPYILCFGAAMPRFVGKCIIEILCVHELIYVI